MRSRSRSRSAIRFALIAACCAVAAVLVAPAAVADSPLCDPTTGPDQFCVTFASSVPGTLVAADPVGLGFTFANDSQNVTTSENAWIDHVDLQLLAAPNAPLRPTPSADLPDDLLLAGGDGDCVAGTNSDFVTCDAGHGTLEANIESPALGFKSGTFGITKVVNVANDGDAATDFSWDVTFSTCVKIGSNPCSVARTVTERLGGALAHGGVGATISLPAFYHEVTQVATADVTLTQVSLALLAQTSTLSDGSPAGGTFTVAELPIRCGNASGTASFVSHGNVGGNTSPSTLDFPMGAVVTGCPAAAAALDAIHFGATGPSADLNGGGSSASNGRTVAQYRWQFGDGKKQTTTSVTVTHKYPASPTSAKDYLEKLVVVDSAGAVSAPSASVTLRGTEVTIGTVSAVGTKLVVSGAVAPNEHPGQVSIALRRKVSGVFHTVITANAVALSASSGFTHSFTRPAAGTCQAVVKYAGRPADAVLGSIGSKNFPC
jgi:hypothetical protein